MNTDLRTNPARPTVEVAVALLLRECPDPPPTGGPTGASRYEVLITKRLANTFYPGYWEFPGGKIDPGESPEDAAAREVREELGMAVTPRAVLPEVVHTYDHATVRLHGVVCRVAGDSPPPTNIQVADHRWCGLDALPWSEFLPANVRLITALSRWLEAGGISP